MSESFKNSQAALVDVEAQLLHQKEINAQLERQVAALRANVATKAAIVGAAADVSILDRSVTLTKIPGGGSLNAIDGDVITTNAAKLAELTSKNPERRVYQVSEQEFEECVGLGYAVSG